MYIEGLRQRFKSLKSLSVVAFILVILPSIVWAETDQKVIHLWKFQEGISGANSTVRNRFKNENFSNWESFGFYSVWLTECNYSEKKRLSELLTEALSRNENLALREINRKEFVKGQNYWTRIKHPVAENCDRAAEIKGRFEPMLMQWIVSQSSQNVEMVEIPAKTVVRLADFQEGVEGRASDLKGSNRLRNEGYSNWESFGFYSGWLSGCSFSEKERIRSILGGALADIQDSAIREVNRKEFAKGRNRWNRVKEVTSENCNRMSEIKARFEPVLMQWIVSQSSQNTETAGIPTKTIVRLADFQEGVSGANSTSGTRFQNENFSNWESFGFYEVWLTECNYSEKKRLSALFNEALSRNENLALRELYRKQFVKGQNHWTRIKHPVAENCDRVAEIMARFEPQLEDWITSIGSGMNSNQPPDLSSLDSNTPSSEIAQMSTEQLCRFATKISNGRFIETSGYGRKHLAIALERGVDCVAFMNEKENRSQIVKVEPKEVEPSTKNDPDDSERVKVLEQRLAQLEAEKIDAQQAVAEDLQTPVIRITSAKSDGARGTIAGVASDNTGIAEVLVDGQAVAVDSDGRFNHSTFIPSGGAEVQITAYDLKGLSTTETVSLERTQRTDQFSRLAPVNPLLGPKQKASRDRVALIIGLEKYEASAPAQFASRDAQMFADYAREKLGIHAGNVKVLTDSGASEREILTALKVWLPTAVKPDTTDLYVFYAGHGMPTADGTSAYLVPYDGDVRLLEDTAISRKRFFDEIGAAKPRTATFFFDNCYSGATRSEELLLASRPLSIKVPETDVPDNYLVFTAGESNQTAGVLDEVKHGRFSYFVFKGLEGEADANQDGKISAGELHQYVRESVGRFSAGAQTPTMLGDAGRWVLR